MVREDARKTKQHGSYKEALVTMVGGLDTEDKEEVRKAKMMKIAELERERNAQRNRQRTKPSEGKVNRPIENKKEDLDKLKKDIIKKGVVKPMTDILCKSLVLLLGLIASMHYNLFCQVKSALQILFLMLRKFVMRVILVRYFCSAYQRRFRNFRSSARSPGRCGNGKSRGGRRH